MGVTVSKHRRELQRIRYRQLVRRINRTVYRTMWAIRNRPITDEERFALRLARMHIREGRPELAAEDFAWLERRLSS